jgi:uncharacterized damage-inducible protein DinB
MADRPVPPFTGDERATLTGFLDLYRATIAGKCEGLTPEQLAERAVPPSPLSLLGLVRHLGEVESGWFRRISGQPLAPRYSGEDDPDGDFHSATADATQVEDAFRYWREQIEYARRVVAETDLDATFVHPRRRVSMSLRWVLVHLIEEYARHAGHADFLRERIDGSTGP